MDPAVAKELFQRAVELFGQEDYAGALSCYEQLSAAFPRNNDVVHERIQCQIALGRFQEAAEWIRYLGDELGDLRANVLQTQIPEGAESAVQSGVGSLADKTLLGRFLRFTSTLSDGTLALLAVLLLVAIFGMYFYLVAFPKMYRLLPFNENTSIGTLDIRDPESENPVWTPWRDAQGKMYASRKMQLRLNLTKLADDSGYSSLRLNTLADFEPDSFWEVDASDSGIGDDGLRELAVLSGVHHMNLRNADVVGSGFVLFLPETTVETLDISDNPFETEWLPWVAQFETMESLNIHNTRIDDEGLSHLAEHSGLRFLELPDDAGDDGLKHLGGLTRLESLDLSRRRVTDRGLSFLGGLESLRELNLSATSISDKGIASLIPLERLRSLNLSYTRVGDDALVSIGELVQLRTLDLTATRVTDIGLYSLAPLESLRSLNLSNHHTLSAITDSGIQALTELPLLEELDLSGSLIGRASVGLLGSLNLSELKLEETYLSESEAAELAALIPAATITHVPLTRDVVTFDGNDDLGMLWIRGQDQSDAGRWIPFASARGRVRLA
ncbi:MAG: tetratricopeptide repeat protein, partial [Candidatus Hydrogenedentota bacterium]